MLKLCGKHKPQMRDLAQQNYSRTNFRIPGSVGRVVLLLIIVIAILFVARSVINLGGVGGSSVQLKDAPKGLTPVSLSGDVVSADEGIDLVIESATFQNVSDVSGTASASRKYGDGSFSMTVNATLPDPKGNPYQVWIVGDGQVTLAGTMNGSASSWGLVFNDRDKNFSKMGKVWITREITVIDGIPEKHILEGSF